MNNTDVPIWEKYTLTIEEASKYFRIGGKQAASVSRGKPYRWLGDYERKPYSNQEETV